MCELQPILDQTLVGSSVGSKDIFVNERLHGGCGTFALLALDTSGKVFNVTMAMTCRWIGHGWVRDVWKRSKSTREAKG